MTITNLIEKNKIKSLLLTVYPSYLNNSKSVYERLTLQLDQIFDNSYLFDEYLHIKKGFLSSLEETDANPYDSKTDPNLKKYKNKYKIYNFKKLTEEAFTIIFKECSNLKDYGQNYTDSNFLNEDIAGIFSFIFIISLIKSKKSIINYNYKKNKENLINEAYIVFSEKKLNNEELKKNGLKSSKLDFINEFKKNFDLIFLCFSNFYKINIDIKGDQTLFLAQIIMYLSANDWIDMQNENIQTSKNKFASVFEINLKKNKNFIDNEYNDNLDYCIDLYLSNTQVYKSSPYLFINKFYRSDDIEIDEKITIPDNIFDYSKNISENNKYGWIEKGRKKSLKSSVINNDSDFFKFMQKINSQKYKIDEKSFKEVFKHITSVKLQLEINLEDSIEKNVSILKSYLKLYSESNSKDNKNLMHDLLKILELINLYSIYKEQGFFYFKVLFDFRSRLYYESVCSLTNFKYLRYFLTEEDYTEEELLKIIKNSTSSTSFKKFKEVFIQENFKLRTLLNDDFFNEKYNNFPEYKEYKIILAFSNIVYLGSIDKSKILKEKSKNTMQEHLDLIDFFNHGLSDLILYNQDKISFLENLKNEDDETFFKKKKLLEFLTNSLNLYKKNYVGMDFSASGHQLRYLKYGLYDKNVYSLININSSENKWYDIYSFFTNKFIFYIKNNHKNNFSEFNQNIKLSKEKKVYLGRIKEYMSGVKDDEDLIFQIFNRSIFKKSIMTIEYNVTVLKFMDYAEKEIQKFLIEKKNKDTVFIKKFIIQIRPFILIFYDFCKNIEKYEKSIKFEQKSEDIYHILSELLQYKLEHFDGFITPLAVFKESDKEVRIVFHYKNKNKKHRATVVIPDYTNEVNLKDTLLSLIPNFIHSMDAVLLRALLYSKWWSKTVYFTIHDEYWLPIQERFLFIDHVNFLIKRDFTVTNDKNDKISCIFEKEIKSFEEFKKKIDHKLKIFKEDLRDFFSLFVLL